MILAHTFPVAITDSTLTINQDLKALIPVKKETGEYLFIAIKSIAKNILFATKEATHGTRRIETQVLQNWAIPWPPLEEQEEIVRRVENLFQKCDQIEARYQTAKAYTDKLTQAILAKAFRGELVPQDPNDEPAEVLLERIKAEKDGAEPQKKRRQSQSKPGKKEA
jgi:type I restriction enzyme S subunit